MDALVPNGMTRRHLDGYPARLFLTLTFFIGTTKLRELRLAVQLPGLPFLGFDQNYQVHSMGQNKR